MEATLTNERPDVRLRAFRAIDDPEACRLFLEGHAYVLTSIGITKVTSSRNEWTTNPAAFVLIVESLDGKRVYGGARVHVSGGSQPLPIEEATSRLDSGIVDLVWKFAQQGTGELCGLWNSREIAGYGIGSIFLIRAAVAIAHQVGLQSLFALCAPYTIKPVECCGMELESSIGNKGTFYYPKLDLLATTMILKDVAVLSRAQEEDRNAIFKIRKEPDVVRVEELRKKEITIHYQTAIRHLDKWHLKEIIANTNKIPGNKILDFKDPEFL
jgi:hypothetical protein